MIDNVEMPNYHPAPLPSLRDVDAYTSWPGGVDPTVKLYNVNNQAGGKNRKASRKNRKASRKNRKASRKTRNNRK